MEWIKRGKFLYGGFAVVAIGGIVAMLVSVFSPPKQIAEETIKTSTPPSKIEQSSPEPVAIEPTQPATEYGVRYFDDNGNEIIPTQEIIDAFKALDEELDPQEEEQKALDKAEKEWWESRQDWVNRFPFEPTPHPEITFDPTVYDSRKVFRGEWPEERKDKAYWEMKRRVEHHSLLKDFYDSWVRYTEEFEQLHDIVEEELGETASTAVLAVIFETLKDYHQAAQRDPDSIYRENAEVIPPDPEPTYPMDTMVVLGPDFQNLPQSKQNEIITELTNAYREEQNAIDNQQYEVRDITWGEETEMMKRCILGALTNPEIEWEGISKERAIAIRERLINEIPAEGFLELPKVIFASNTKYEFQLKPGDPLLIK